MEKEIQEPGELIFLRYAFPVIGYCSKTQVSEEELSEFEKILKFGGCPSRERLKRIFPDATKHLRTWTPDIVRYYWLGKHNKIVRDNPLCKVYQIEVNDILPPQNGEICRIKIGENFKMRVKSYLKLDKGDRISIHHFQVAEKLSEENFIRYFRK
jgi:hypothetical protein